MSFTLLPNVIFNSVSDIMPDVLHRRNVRLLMMDFDNTLVPYTRSTPSEKVVQWLESMRNSHISLCVVSNSKKEKVKEFCKEYKLDCITNAHKPFGKGVIRCLEKYGVKNHEAAIVGDQIFTDTLAGNLAGVTTILVSAIHNHTIWLKLRHAVELPFIFLARNRRSL